MTITCNEPICQATTTVGLDTVAMLRVLPLAVGTYLIGSEQEDERAFRVLLPSLLDRCRGMFVAISRGQIVGVGSSRPGLAREVFQKQGEDVPLFIGHVSEERPVEVLGAPITR